MIRNFKALGLALVAVFAMSAIASSSASATAGTFHWDSGTTWLTAEVDGATETGGEQVFTIRDSVGGLTVKCNTVTGAAMVAGTSATEVTSETITYTDHGKVDVCRGPLGTSPKIEMNGCDYLFTPGNTVGANLMETRGTVDIKCPPEKTIVINGAGCVVTVPSQNGVGPIDYHHRVTKLCDNRTHSRIRSGRQDQILHLRIPLRRAQQRNRRYIHR
jgi:hypothetical protein